MDLNEVGKSKINLFEQNYFQFMPYKSNKTTIWSIVFKKKISCYLDLYECDVVWTIAFGHSQHSMEWGKSLSTRVFSSQLSEILNSAQSSSWY